MCHADRLLADTAVRRSRRARNITRTSDMYRTVKDSIWVNEHQRSTPQLRRLIEDSLALFGIAPEQILFLCLK